MSKFLASNLNKLKAYTPGEQPQDKKYIKLNTNESPYPPSKSVIEAVNSEEIENLRLYSDPTANLLKEKLAETYKVNKDNVFISNGSDEILNFAFLAYGEKGVIFPDITYGFYQVFADLYNLDTEIVPLKEDFTIDTDKFVNRNKLIVIANPNAPTGIYIDVDVIENIVKSNPESVVIVDEAYIDFGGESSVKLIKDYENVLVVQTYSKSRSMAGARLGFAFADKKITEDLEKIKYSTNPYNVNRITQLCGINALKDNNYYMDNCKKIIKTREKTINALKDLGFYVTDSTANFIFAKSSLIGGNDLYLALKEKGVLVRHFEKDRLKDFNRITIGSESEMDSFISAVKSILEERNEKN